VSETGYKETPIWSEAEGGKAAYCQHDVESLVHCCLCHNGFIFDGMQHDPDCPYYDMLRRSGKVKVRFEHGRVARDFMVAFGLNWDEINVWRLYFIPGLWYFNICFDRR